MLLTDKNTIVKIDKGELISFQNKENDTSYQPNHSSSELTTRNEIFVGRTREPFVIVGSVYSISIALSYSIYLLFKESK